MSYKVPKDVYQVRCSRCGRFLGYESIKSGFVLFYCPKCKSWTIQVGKKTNVESVLKEIQPFIDHLTKEKKGISSKVDNQVSS